MLLINLALSGCFTLQQVLAVVYNDEPLRADMFSHLDCKEEIVRLDNYAGVLGRTPSTTSVIIGYAGRNDTKRGEITARLRGIRRYLVENSGIDKNRIVILNGGFREQLNIELWVIPNPNREDATLLINATVPPKDVRFKKGSIKIWEYTCKRR